MRQQPAYSKADLVAWGARPATDNIAMASNPIRALAAADEIIVVAGFARYIRSREFRRPDGTVRRRLWRMPRMVGNNFAAAPGGANWLNPKPGVSLPTRI
jgi:hypothetical protein